MTNYEPTTLSGDKYKTFEIEGWYKMTVKKVTPGTSSGGYSQLLIISEISDGEYAGCQNWYYMMIPTLKKAYALMEVDGKDKIDRNNPTYWTRRLGWTLSVFDIDLNKNNKEAETIKAMQNLDNLDKLVPKIEGASFVAKLKPTTYPKVVTDESGKATTETRIGTELIEIRDKAYVPAEGFVGSHSASGSAQTLPQPPDNVELDPDLDLEEDEDFFVD